MAKWNINNSMGDSLEHHGILGMHWGIRRFQRYPDGNHSGKEVGEAAKQKPRKAKKIQKDIRKTETKIYSTITDYNRLHERGMQLNEKVKKRLIKDTKKGHISNKTLKSQDKLEQIQKDLDRMKSEIPKRTKEINNLLKEAKVGGYKIDNVKDSITISRYPQFYTYNIDTFKISNKK